MKVLHINEHLDWAGGVETYLLSLLPELESRGHRQTVVYAKGRAQLVPDSHCLPELSLGTRVAEKEAEVAMNRILDQVQPDLVHLHQVYNTGAVRACLQRVPVLIHGHDYRYLCPASTFYYKRSREVCGRTCGPGCFTTTLRHHCMSPRPAYAFNYYRRVKWFAAKASHFAGVVAPSTASGARFIAGGFGTGQVNTLPYFCPLAPALEPRVMPTRPTVLFIGRIRPSKGVETFLEALARLPETVQGLMVGDFNEASRQEMQTRAAALGLAGRLVLQGWVGREAIRQVFEQATVFAFPSIWPETLGIVGLEALACGVPVVASDIGGVREWLRPDETGLLVPPKNPVALAEGLQALLFDAERNRAYGRNGIELVRKAFSRESHIDRLIEVYRSCSQTGSVRAVVH